MYNFGFQRGAVSNAESYPTFWQTLLLPSSALIWTGWEFLKALYRAGRRWQ